ncbi:MAG TPA: hypothetical protein VEU33_22185 [Archangium sp.]|nr:hypothetical protein [Archangium sp.]
MIPAKSVRLQGFLGSLGSKERKYALELDSGLADYVLPIDERQCFERLDLHRARLDRSEVPGRIKKSQNAHLLVAVDCETIGL